jgi:hypothetical protein
MLDKPQDARFYDWILVDPKDKPYATFLFHYRSWEFLQALQLIPPKHPRLLLKPSNSFAFLAPLSGLEGSQSDDDIDDWDNNEEEERSSNLGDSPPWKPAIAIVGSSKPLNEVKNSPEKASKVNGSDEARKPTSSAQDEEQNHLEPPISTFAVPQATLDEWHYERPLPNPPKAKSSFDHSRKSSTSSNAPSITPSLLHWVEGGSENPSPEPVIGVAAAVPLLPPSSSSQPATSVQLASMPETHENDLPPPIPRKSSQRPPTPSPFSTRITSNPFIVPPEAIVSPPDPDLAIRTRRQSSSYTISRPRLIIADSSDDDNNTSPNSLRDRFRRTSMPPSEGEWLAKQASPSPIKRASDDRRGLWSFRNRRASRSVSAKDEGFVNVNGKGGEGKEMRSRSGSVGDVKEGNGKENEKYRGDNVPGLRSLAQRFGGGTVYEAPEWI